MCTGRPVKVERVRRLVNERWPVNRKNSGEFDMVCFFRPFASPTRNVCLFTKTFSNVVACGDGGGQKLIFCHGGYPL